MSAEQAIRDLVRDYCRGMHEADEALMRRVFHPLAAIVGRFSNHAIASGLDDFVAGMMAEPSAASLGHELEFEVLQLRVDGAVASVVVADVLHGMRFVDHLALTHMDGAWRIVGKAFATDAAFPGPTQEVKA